MAPNLFVALQKASRPDKWFKPSDGNVPLSAEKFSYHPVPGFYKLVPGAGCYLVRLRENDVQQRAHINLPQKVVYSDVMRRWLLEDDFNSRCVEGQLIDKKQKKPLMFFRLKDDVTWVNCYDSQGEFIKGPYVRYCRDEETGMFRAMLKGDDPRFQAKRTQSVAPGGRKPSSRVSTGRTKDERRSQPTLIHKLKSPDADSGYRLDSGYNSGYTSGYDSGPETPRESRLDAFHNKQKSPVPRSMIARELVDDSRSLSHSSSVSSGTSSLKSNPEQIYRPAQSTRRFSPDKSESQWGYITA